MAIKYERVVFPLSDAKKTPEQKALEDEHLTLSFRQSAERLEGEIIDNRPRSERRREVRQKAKEIDRALYLNGNTVETRKPWIADGISHRTWFRRQKAKGELK